MVQENRECTQEETRWAQGIQRRGDKRHTEDLVSLLFRGHCLLLCDLGQVTSPLCALVSSSVKWRGYCYCTDSGV